jgi:hypothetical protein
MRSRYTRLRELTLMQRTELELGPGLPVFAGTGEYAAEDIGAAYERLPRRGFRTYAEMKRAWELHGAQLMEDDPAGPWWGFQEFSDVKVSDLVGGDE